MNLLLTLYFVEFALLYVLCWAIFRRLSIVDPDRYRKFGQPSIWRRASFSTTQFILLGRFLSLKDRRITVLCIATILDTIASIVTFIAYVRMD